MSATRKPWTREELIVAINLYCRTPFGRIHVRNPEIIALAEQLDRTPGSVSFKLANFASIDPTLNRRGASNTSKLDREVWDEFFSDWESMITMSEELMAELPSIATNPKQEPIPTDRQGEDIPIAATTRRNQHFFRQMVLSSYGGKCCITGIDTPELLVASHIRPWAHDPDNRLNPMNGLCLNALHDRAFDRGLISLDESYAVLVSPRVSHDFFTQYRDQPIIMPERFRPDLRFWITIENRYLELRDSNTQKQSKKQKALKDCEDFHNQTSEGQWFQQRQKAENQIAQLGDSLRKSNKSI